MLGNYDATTSSGSVLLAVSRHFELLNAPSEKRDVLSSGTIARFPDSALESPAVCCFVLKQRSGNLLLLGEVFLGNSSWKTILKATTASSCTSGMAKKTAKMPLVQVFPPPLPPCHRHPHAVGGASATAYYLRISPAASHVTQS